MGEVAERYLQRILAAPDFDQTYAAVDDLLDGEGVAEALRLALLWSAGAEPGVRAAGLDVLAAVAQKRDDVTEVALREANRVSAADPDEDLRWSAAHLLGSLPRLPDRLVRPVLNGLLRFEADPDGDVRWQVVFALPGLAGPEPSPDHPAVQALLRRLDDGDPGVRDWAAFGIGLTGVGTAEVRRALHRLLAHPEQDAAGEAAVALARLKDPSVLPELLRQLARGDVGNLWVEAAAELAAPEALPLLERLAAIGWTDDEPLPHLLAEAILACAPDGDQGAGQRHDAPPTADG